MMAGQKLPVTVLCATVIVLLFGKAALQEIRLEKSEYFVSEDISTRNLVLMVCVDGSSLENQTYNIQIQTEVPGSSAATDGEDYVGIAEELMLRGPGEDTQCTCVDILEDDEREQEERFGVRISGNSFITQDSADAFIRDNDGISFEFRGDTPHVEGNEVTFELQFDPNVVSAACGVIAQARLIQSVDCSNGTAHFTLPSRGILFHPTITTRGPQGGIEVSQDPNRSFRVESTRRCSAHLINKGIDYNPVSGDTTFEWVWSGPGAEGRFLCYLDFRFLGRCSSPRTFSGLSDGPHILTISLRRGECAARLSRTFVFNIPLP